MATANNMHLPTHRQKHRVWVIKSEHVHTSKRPTTAEGGSTAGGHEVAPPLLGLEATFEGVLSSIPDSPNCAALLHQKQRHPKSGATHCYHGVIKFKTQMREAQVRKFLADAALAELGGPAGATQPGPGLSGQSEPCGWSHVVGLPSHHNFAKVCSQLNLEISRSRDWLTSIPVRVLFADLP